MKRASLCVMAFIALSGCTPKEEVQIPIRNMPFDAVVRHLDLDLELEESIETSGFYGVDRRGELHGRFKVGFKEVGQDQRWGRYFVLRSIEGKYSEGAKDNTWTYKYEYDDGVDMYEKHTITIFYQEGACLRSGFYGAIGHQMPTVRYRFKSLCSPEDIRLKAWEYWSRSPESKLQH